MAERVTRRYPQPITLRYRPQSITLPYQSPATVSTQTPVRAPDALLMERFRLEEGPLGEPPGGEAEVWRAIDLQRGSEVALKLYHHQAAPRREVVEQLCGLRHAHIVSLYEWGEWQGRFYEVMAYCPAGPLSAAGSLDEIHLRRLLPGLVGALDYCHRQGIVHRDVKPANVFFASEAREALLLADFGISSTFDPATSVVRVTASAAHLTLDYAAPELLDGHQVHPGIDYYALGISLLHALIGQSPFAACSSNDVLVAHLRGRIPLPSTLSPPFQQLIQGLTHGDAASRWGHAEVMGWLHGEQVRLAPPRVRSAARSGYPGYPDATTAAELADALPHFEAASQLLNGDIRRWLFDEVDADLARQVEVLVEQWGQHPKQALARLPYVLDPSGPLRVGTKKLYTLHDVLQQLREDPGSLRPVLSDGALAFWLSQARPDGEHAETLLAWWRQLDRALSPAQQVFALHQRLDPARPLALGPALHLRRREDLIALLRHHRRALIDGLIAAIEDESLALWLLAQDAHEDAALVRDVARRYSGQGPLAAWCVLWRLIPALHLPFGSQRIRQPQDLVALVESAPQHHRRALELLRQGWLRAWLVGSHRIRPIQAIDEVLLMLDMSDEARLEALLQRIDPTLTPPQLRVSLAHLHFGTLRYGQVRQRRIELANATRGHLHGVVRLAQWGQGLAVEPMRFEGPTTLQLSVETEVLQPGHYRNTLLIDSNGGSSEIEIGYTVRAAEETRQWWQRWLDGD